MLWTSKIDARVVDWFDIAALTSWWLDALHLLVVVGDTSFAADLFNALVVDIVDLDNVVDQMMVEIVVSVDDLEQVVVVPVDIDNYIFVVLMVNYIVLAHRLAQIKALINVFALGLVWMLNETSLTLTDFWIVDTAHVWCW